MDREESLERSRQENKVRDEWERDVQAKAAQRAIAYGGILCGIVIILDSLFADQVNYSTWAVYLCMTGTMLLTKYRYLKKRSHLVFGALQLGLAVLLLGIYIARLMGVYHG